MNTIDINVKAPRVPTKERTLITTKDIWEALQFAGIELDNYKLIYIYPAKRLWWGGIPKEYSKVFDTSRYNSSQMICGLGSTDNYYSTKHYINKKLPQEKQIHPFIENCIFTKEAWDLWFDNIAPKIDAYLQEVTKEHLKWDGSLISSSEENPMSFTINLIQNS